MPRFDSLPRLFALCLMVTAGTNAAAQADLPIQADRLVYGQLTVAHAVTSIDGASVFHQHYLYEGRAGERINVSATSSKFEAAVALYAPGGDGALLADHAGASIGDEWRAFVTMTLTAPGQYVICVHSHRPGSTGEYSLLVTSRRQGAGPTPAATTRRPVCMVQGEAFATNATWFINNDPITVNNRRYLKYGLPRILNPGEVSWYALFRGAGVYVEPGTQAMRPEVLYVAVRPDCEFQPYQLAP